MPAPIPRATNTAFLRDSTRAALQTTVKSGPGLMTPMS